MAPPRITAQDIIDILPPREEETPIEGDDARIQDTIAAGLGGDDNVVWRIQVFKIMGPASRGPAGSEPWIFDCDYTEFPLNDRLLEEYGTGTYRIKVLRNGKLWRRGDISILKTDNPSKKSNQSEQSELMLFLQEQRERDANRDQLLIEAMRGTRQDSGAQMLALFEKIVLPIIQAKPVAPEPVAATALFDAFTKGLTAGTEAAGSASGGGGDDTITSIVAGAIKQLPWGDIAGRVMQNNPPAPQIAPPQPPQQMQPIAAQDAAHVASVAPVAPAQQPVIAATPMEQLQAAILFLIPRAEADMNPAIYAHMLLQEQPEENIKLVLSTPDFLNQLAGVNSQVKQFYSWFRELLDIMAELDKAESEQADAGQDASKSSAN